MQRALCSGGHQLPNGYSHYYTVNKECGVCFVVTETVEEKEGIFLKQEHLKVTIRATHYYGELTLCFRRE